MTKAIAKHTRKWLLAASLLLVAGAAQAQSWVMIGIPVYANGTGTYQIFGMAPVVTSYSGGPLCNAAFAALQAQSAAYQASLNAISGTYNDTGSAVGGCFDIGPSAGALPASAMNLTESFPTYAQSSFLNLPAIPVVSHTACVNNLAAVEAKLAPIWTTTVASNEVQNAACLD